MVIRAKTKIGVLALQGAFAEHIHMLRHLGVSATEVRLPQQLEDLDGLVIPGGESTTIGKLATMYQLVEPLRRFATFKPVWGTCAGMILLSKNIGQDQPLAQPLLGLMDITVERNAFGRQIMSFREDLTVDVLKNGRIQPFRGIFIRSPRIIEYKDGVHIIARLARGAPVAARQNQLLVTSFHPELTNDDRFHRYFLSMIH